MYQKFINEYNNKIEQYKKTIDKAKESNKKCLKNIVLIYAIPLAISFLLPEPVFELPLVWPLLSVSASSLLSVRIFEAYKKTNDVIEDSAIKMDKLQKEVEEMEEYERTRKQNKTTKCSYSKSNNNHEANYEPENKKGRGRR